MHTWLALAAEWQRNWAQTNAALALNDVVKQRVAGSSIAYLWEQLSPFSTTQPKFRIEHVPFVWTEIVDIKFVSRGNSLFAVSAPRSRDDH